MGQLIIKAQKAEEMEVYQVSAGKKRSLAGKKIVSSVILHFLLDRKSTRLNSSH